MSTTAWDNEVKTDVRAGADKAIKALQEVLRLLDQDASAIDLYEPLSTAYRALESADMAAASSAYEAPQVTGQIKR